MAPKVSDFKYVLLDLDNTLYPYLPAHQASQNAVIDHLAGNLDFSRTDISTALYIGRKETHNRLCGTAASHNRLLYFQASLEKLGVQAISMAYECYQLYWRVFLENMELFPEAKALLDQLRPDTTCIVTDLTADIQFRKMEKLCLTEKIRHIVTSEEAGAEKPNPVIFHIALEKLEAKPSDCCMIGDSFDRDALGASTQGIHCFWLTTTSLEKYPLISNIASLRDCHD
jgi:putative hydrolase of the HAD superfamily